MAKKRARKSGSTESERPRWNWGAGWRAAVWGLLCAEGVLAGGDRPCMPSFNPDLLIGHMLIMHVAGVAEALGFCAALPAFLAAAIPTSVGLDPLRRTATAIGLALLVLSLQLFVSDAIIWIPLLGLLIGALVRWYPWVRSNWLLLALLTAVGLGVIQFSGLAYSNNKCWP
ncbi:MAG TPA: hypothetical protein VJN22_08870 [Candidatus Eremiobacteraceae bacterium]|nr:hypothetical protein [Candidatus Eremiobacteraceae bacterium]